MLTRAESLALEVKFQNSVSPVGPMFLIGVLIGFIVGMMISYQILYTDLSDHMPQYATLKAMGYKNSYLMRVMLEYVALLRGSRVFARLGIEHRALSSDRRDGVAADAAWAVTISLSAFPLTVGMCVLSGILAVRPCPGLRPR